MAGVLLVGAVGVLGLTHRPPEGLPPLPTALTTATERLEINAADSAAWEALPGIGPATARRIVRFRTALGGQFYSLDQLGRIWGLDTLLPRLTGRLYLDSTRLVAIDINAADTLAWRRLPGIYPSLARRIVRYRTARGGFVAVDDLQRVWGLDSLYPVIRPFLVLGPVPKTGRRVASTVFDPPRDVNAVTARELAQLVPAWLANRVVKYRTAAGGYDSLPQLRRLYGMTDAYYARLEASLYLKPRPDTALTRAGAYAFTRSLGYNQPPSQRLDLNRADTLALASLPGIGPALARRIVERRAELGFFHSLGQLDEVYGLHDTLQRDLRQWFFIAADLGPYPHLHINRATEVEIAAHPYLSHSLARRLVRYRAQHGPYGSMVDLAALAGVPPGTWARLAPYLVFD